MSERAELLVEVTRGPIVESRHFGHIVVVSVDGSIVASVGNPQHVTYWRSAAKPVQAVPVVESGAAEHFGFSAEEIALMGASHSGEEKHRQVAMSMLRKMGLGVEALRCGGTPTPLACNCSGKHAGMLALALQMGVTLDGYTDLNHPVQQANLKAVSKFTGLERSHIVIGVDGCGVPVFGIPLYNMALAYAKLSHPTAPEAGLSERERAAVMKITGAMMAKPYFVAGTGRLCTELMRVFNGKLLGKTGAEGVYCMSLMQKGIGVALKVEDGNARALGPAVVETLSQLGLIGDAQKDALATFWRQPVLNLRSEVVGEIRPAFELRFAHSGTSHDGR
ncbi:MAG TPA: asparaginase [Firmicutes bacterium]|nr:asparaginase [Bacillota bacterium]